MNKTVIDNFSKMKLSIFFLPLFLLFTIFIYLYFNNGLDRETYTACQKEWFLFLNKKLSAYPSLMYNATQLGDGLIILSLLTVSVIYVPRIWGTLIIAVIISGIITSVLKKIFSIKRPAAAFVHENFTVIGERLTGHNSFPSGHSITTFTVLTVILFAFMPKGLLRRFIWSFCICAIGFMIISTRIAVGAHLPFDVLTGAVLGYISAISGILINQKYNIWNWISNRKFYPIFILLFLVSSGVIISKILETNLAVFYLALISLFISLFIITKIYVKKVI